MSHIYIYMKDRTYTQKSKSLFFFTGWDVGSQRLTECRCVDCLRGPICEAIERKWWFNGDVFFFFFFPLSLSIYKVDIRSSCPFFSPKTPCQTGGSLAKKGPSRVIKENHNVSMIYQKVFVSWLLCPFLADSYKTYDLLNDYIVTSFVCQIHTHNPPCLIWFYDQGSHLEVQGSVLSCGSCVLGSEWVSNQNMTESIANSHVFSQFFWVNNWASPGFSSTTLETTQFLIRWTAPSFRPGGAAPWGYRRRILRKTWELRTGRAKNWQVFFFFVSGWENRIFDLCSFCKPTKVPKSWPSLLP